jgi:CubicO group peptidase (beta-lactamase class C family)
LAANSLRNSGGSVTSPDPWPDGLQRRTPEEEGVSSEKILAFLDAAADGNFEVHGFMLMRNQRVVAEGWWKPYRSDRPHMTHSLTKSVLATGVGMALDEGRFSLDDPVVSFFPDRDRGSWSDNLRAMTVRDLLTMQSGHGEETSGANWRQITTSWVDEFLKIPVPHPPGSHWVYTSAASYMLSAILTMTTGLTAEAYMRPRFFEPMRITNYSWDVSPEGYSTGGNGLSWTTADSLKLGALYAAKGNWKGRQLLSENFVTDAAQGLSTGPYGYHWWMGENGAYYALGLFGQFCVVFPQYNAVLAIFSGIDGGKRLLPLIWEHFPAAFQKTAPAPLAQRCRELSLMVPLASPVQAGRTGKMRYAITENDQGVTAVSFSFQEGCCEYSMSDHRGEHRIKAGIDQWLEQDTSMTGHRLHHGYQPDKIRVTALARWRDADTLEMTWQFVETAFRDTVLCVFSGDTVVINRSVNVNSAERSLPALAGLSVSQ